MKGAVQAMATVQFLGHATFYVEGNGIKALIDPFLSGNPLASENAEKISELAPNYIFVTHAHQDHLGDTISIAKKTGATVVATNELAMYLQGKGLNVVGMHVGGRKQFDFGSVKLTAAFHGSSVSEEGALVCSDTPCGFLIEVDGKKIYHAGDTGLTVEMTLLEEEKVDVALLPIGGHYTMDIRDAVRAVSFIKPKKAVPMHYNTFPPIKSDPSEFKNLAGGKSDVVILNPGEKINL